jgi:hypothetical protein
MQAKTSLGGLNGVFKKEKKQAKEKKTNKKTKRGSLSDKWMVQPKLHARPRKSSLTPFLSFFC